MLEELYASFACIAKLVRTVHGCKEVGEAVGVRDGKKMTRKEKAEMKRLRWKLMQGEAS